MINQAIAMDYALTGKDLSQYDSAIDMFKKRMSIIAESGTYPVFRTSDGLVYCLGCGYAGYGQYENYDPTRDITPENNYMPIRLYTDRRTPTIDPDLSINSIDINIFSETESSPGNLTGVYDFYCGYDRCVPSPSTAAILNSADPTKVDSGS